MDFERLNLAPLLKDPAQKSDLTGRATVDLRMKSEPATARVVDRVKGTFAFEGPRVVAARLRRAQREGYGIISTVPDHDRRPRGCIRRHRHCTRFHRDAGARPRARVRSAGERGARRPAKASGVHRRADSSRPTCRSPISRHRRGTLDQRHRDAQSVHRRRRTHRAGHHREFDLAPRRISYAARGAVADSTCTVSAPR